VTYRPEPDEMGPWCIVTRERVGDGPIVVTAYGPASRSIIEEVYDRLDIPEPLDRPFSAEAITIIEREDEWTRATLIAFGAVAEAALHKADTDNGHDPDKRWRRAQREGAGRSGNSTPVGRRSRIPDGRRAPLIGAASGRCAALGSCGTSDYAAGHERSDLAKQLLYGRRD
jgi:hypothetical protein